MPIPPTGYSEGPSPDAFALMVMQRALAHLPADASADARRRLQGRRLQLAQRLIGRHVDGAPPEVLALLTARPSALPDRLPVGEATETSFDSFLAHLHAEAV